MSFDCRTTGNVYPQDDFKPRSRRSIAAKDKPALVEEVLGLEEMVVQHIDWVKVALDALRTEREVTALVRRDANATIKAYEAAFDAKDAQIAALTAALVATRPKTTETRVEVSFGSQVYQRTDTWNDRRQP